MSKFISIYCNEKMKNTICHALRNFACLAYPKTPNSECNLVASDALMNAAESFDKTFSENGYGEINRRLRMMLKTAIIAHYKILSELHNRDMSQQCELMQKVCQGERLTEAELLKIEQLD